MLPTAEKLIYFVYFKGKQIVRFPWGSIACEIELFLQSARYSLDPTLKMPFRCNMVDKDFSTGVPDFMEPLKIFLALIHISIIRGGVRFLSFISALGWDSRVSQGGPGS